MEERKGVLDYLAQILMIFGFMVLAMSIFCLLFGEMAQDVSSLFELGTTGITVSLLGQLLGISVLVVLLRILFFTDLIIKRMPIVLRTLSMLVLIVAVIVVFVICFDWFPVDMWEPWALFFLCFGLSFLVSMAVTIIKEKSENKQMEEALKRLKQREDEK